MNSWFTLYVITSFWAIGAAILWGYGQRELKIMHEEDAKAYKKYSRLLEKELDEKS